MRAVLRDPQLAEQLVEVPTIVSYSWLQLRMEQNVDIPAPGRGGRISGLQGFLPEQSSTAQLVAQERSWSRSLILVRLVEAFKIFAQVRVLQRRLRFLLDTLVKGFFALFPKIKKVRSGVRTRGRN